MPLVEVGVPGRQELTQYQKSARRLSGAFSVLRINKDRALAEDLNLRGQSFQGAAGGVGMGEPVAGAGPWGEGSGREVAGGHLKGHMGKQEGEMGLPKRRKMIRVLPSGVGRAWMGAEGHA